MRSLQSPPELVKPQARSPLLPATRLGVPGSDTPIRRRSRVSRQTIEARYQMLGIARPRCISFATIAPPSAVSRPLTAQLLLPRASSSGGESQASRKSSSVEERNWGCSVESGVGAGVGVLVRRSNTLGFGL